MISKFFKGLFEINCFSFKILIIDILLVFSINAMILIILLVF